MLGNINFCGNISASTFLFIIFVKEKIKIQHLNKKNLTLHPRLNLLLSCIYNYFKYVKWRRIDYQFVPKVMALVRLQTSPQTNQPKKSLRVKLRKSISRSITLMLINPRTLHTNSDLWKTLHPQPNRRVLLEKRHTFTYTDSKTSRKLLWTTEVRWRYHHDILWNHSNIP